MKNFAGVENCDNEIKNELNQANIEVFSYEFMRKKGEVPTSIIGMLGGWQFERAWCYWVAKGPGIPPDIAEELHTTHGKYVRVDGHCGCPSPKEWFNGFAVGCYHIDSQEGLNALAKVIQKILDDNSQKKDN